MIAYIAEAITVLSQNRYKKRLVCSTFDDRKHVIRELLKDKVCLTMGEGSHGYPPITFGMNQWLDPAILEDTVLLRLAPRGLLFVIASWHEHVRDRHGGRFVWWIFVSVLAYVSVTEIQNA